MYEANDLKAHTETKVIDHETWHRVIITEGTSNPVWKSSRLYLDGLDALELAEEINQAIFALTCPVDDTPSEYVEHFGNLDRDPTDMQGYACSSACRQVISEEIGAGL